jgi:8-oxo-dGTP diphosphatase
MKKTASNIASERRPTDVVCAIIRKEDRILIARRGKDQGHAGLWEFPGGTVHEGETNEQALHRELMEELRIKVTILKALAPNIHAYSDKTIRLIPFICRITDGEPTAVEHGELRWIDPRYASGIDWAPADVPILEEYRAWFASQHGA